MAIRIPLPDFVRSQDSKIHPYPYMIGIQTLEFMQGSIFYATIMDIASGAYIRLPDGMANLEHFVTEKLDSKNTYEEAWGILGKYQVVFEKTIFQSVLISMNSHWDWYARRMIDFIVFARRDLNYPELEKPVQIKLDRFSSLPIGEQLEVIQIAAGVILTITEDEIIELQ